MSYDPDKLDEISDRVSYMSREMSYKLTRDLLCVAGGSSLILAICTLAVPPINWTLFVIASATSSISLLLLPLVIYRLKHFRRLHPDGIIRRTAPAKPARARWNFPMTLLLATIQLTLITAIAVGFRHLDDQTANAVAFIAGIGSCSLLILSGLLWIIGAIRHMLR